MEPEKEPLSFPNPNPIPRPLGRPPAQETAPKRPWLGASRPAAAKPALPSFKPLKLKTASAPARAKEQDTDPFGGIAVVRSPGPRTGGPLLGRFRGLKSRDITLIAAGFSVLLMAPLAEHIISSGADEAGTLQAGFDQKGTVFSRAGSPYEDGIAGAAPGGLLGQDSELITPLNARDPSALIVGGPGGEAPPVKKAVKMPRPAPAPTTGWRDAISSAAKRSVAAVTRRAPLPRPSVKLTSRLNALSSGSSGSGGHSSSAVNSLPAPSTKEFFGNPHASSNLSRVQVAPDYRGAARRGLASGGGGPGVSGGRNGMGTGAGGSGGTFLEPRPMGSGSGSALSSLVSGHASFDGDAKSPGLNGQGENKNITINQKEDLAYERRKLEMQKSVDLKYAKKMYDQVERKKMLDQIKAQTASQAALKVLDKLLDLATGKGGGQGGQSGGSGGGKGGSGGDQSGASKGGASPESASASPKSLGAPPVGASSAQKVGDTYVFSPKVGPNAGMKFESTNPLPESGPPPPGTVVTRGGVQQAYSEKDGYSDLPEGLRGRFNGETPIATKGSETGESVYTTGKGDSERSVDKTGALVNKDTGTRTQTDATGQMGDTGKS